MDKAICKLGLDIGSTTVKCAALKDGKAVYSYYKRHMSDISGAVTAMVEDAYAALGDIDVYACVTGSGGLSVSKWLGLPFVQEVIAASNAVKEFIPETDVAIELGGEDAKITYFSGSTEQRMNGTCAGGTGAFIDQMASLLQTDAKGLDELAAKATNIYEIAARCGVFAKSDIQPLINEGAAREDIAASVFKAVVNQTISGLACGHPIRGRIAFLGGPLHFLPSLKAQFVETLKLTPENIMETEHAMMFVAAGAAIMADKKVSLKALAERTRTVSDFEDTSTHLKPLFRDEAEYEEFKKRHAAADVAKETLNDYSGACFLGIDAGSTTTKAALISQDGRILHTHYRSNEGRPLEIIKEILNGIFDLLPEGAYIAHAASTGYGEGLAKAAFTLDCSEVETVAHYTAAKHFKPDTDFILDIGGQDMKCMRIQDGVIDEVILNEACSSGCGSFLETFAASLGCTIKDFASRALSAPQPVDLGSRCTVFMNSKVRQAQKEGAKLGDISAGLSYSVVKNALYKVIKLKNASELGQGIVVQGGTFLNDAVLRALELLSGREVVRPAIAGLMGAYGAALIAREKCPKGAVSAVVSKEALGRMQITKTNTRCGGCENNCRLTVNSFGDGRKFISGNRCERGAGKSESGKLPDMYDYTYNRMFSYKPLEAEKAARGEIGIPRVLGMYENYPFWHTFFTALSFRVVLSPRSSRSVYTAGIESIPSESLCYPAKLAHGAVRRLIDAGVKTIFFPCVPYEKKEQRRAANHYNCPIVTSYSENIKNNMPEIKENGVDLKMPFLPMDRIARLKRRLVEEFPEIPAVEVKRAAKQAWKEKIAFQSDIRRQGEKVVARVKHGEFKAIILGGRPYHIDPEINHGISSIVTSLGFAVLTEQSVAHLGEYKPTRVLDQWMYHTRIYSAAHLAGKTPGIELVQLNSFGCGLDAVVTDQVYEILKGYGKIYTLIKIDEISNTGAIKIRLRSLAAAISERSRKKGLLGIAEAVKNKAVEYKRVVFEKFMKKEYTILSPQMSPIHFDFLKAAFQASGFKFELLPSVDKSAVEEGLKYVNNDACYPSILVTGQLIEAVKSGRYDTRKLACIISQTGGGCRASNYISFIRKALKDAGYGFIPVISLSAGGIEKNPGFKITLRLLQRVMRAMVYGDLLNRLTLATRPYEAVKGDADSACRRWHDIAIENIKTLSTRRFKRSIVDMVREFDNIPVTQIKKPVIGVVGEILVKYHPTANNQIVKVLEEEGAEVKVPDLIDFLLYCAYNMNFKHEKLGRPTLFAHFGNAAISVIENSRKLMRGVLESSNRFSAPSFISEKAKAAAEFLSIGNQTGEGWFLTGEMAELLREGADGIVCVQPFACLPNHIVGKGVIQPIRARFPEANIVAIDYDPGASEVNQLNRIKLMLSLAQDKIKKAADLGPEEISV
jgi:predicted CoA-substrate-specific enzyme activase